ncbi:tail fiber domain-containing protein [Vibrio diabolicus]
MDNVKINGLLKLSILSASIFYSGFTLSGVGGVCCPFSDSEMKHKVSALPYEEAKPLLSIESKKYQWIEDDSSDIGFLAQDVESVFPELVHEKQGYKTVDYDKILAPMLVLIQHQQKEIERINEKLESLQ